MPCRLAQALAAPRIDDAQGVKVEQVLGPGGPHKYKHPAALTQLDNGDLLIAYHGGSGEYEDDTAVYALRLRAGASKWSGPRVVADTPFHGDGNPVIWQGPEGRVWLFYVVRYGRTWSDSRIHCKVSADAGQSWSDAFVLAFEPGMMVRNQPIVLADGDYLLPVYHEKGHDTENVAADSTSLFLRYSPKTREWSKTPPIRSRIGNIQPGVVQLTPEHLVCYCRRGGGYDGRPDGYLVRSESHDGGKTWAPGQDAPFPNPNAAIDFLKLRSGSLLLIYNDSMTNRTPLTAALSTDGGRTFPYRRNLAEGPDDFAYPYAVQTRDGKLHLVFTSQERTVINHATFTERWLLSATPVKEQGALEWPANARNPEAVKEVLAGKRTAANAAWWGFNEEDATEALQAAIKSGAKQVVVPNLGKDWMVRPIALAGEQELTFEEGVVVTAKRGEYRGNGDCVFRADNLANLTIRGYGATIRMQKEDYIVGAVLKDYFNWRRWFGQYEKAEWRMPLVINGCTNFNLYGLTLRDSGGDGLMLSGAGGKPCRAVHLKDVVCDNNYRQGISVISVDGLLVEDSTFKNTWGTPPSSGVDIEPDSPDQMVKNVVFRNCRFEDNYGDGIEVFLANLRKESGDVSIVFDRCYVASRRGAGIRATKVRDDGPGGLIEFRDCVVNGAEGYGLKVRDKSAGGARVRFVNCTVRNAAGNRNYADTWAPIVLDLSAPDWTKQLGGVDFVNCRVEDPRARPVIVGKCETGLYDVTGTITVNNPHGVQKELPAKQERVTLAVEAEPFVGHVKVYAEPGRFGGWPANHGIWSWDNEILVGFSAGYFKDRGPERHAIDPGKPEEHLLARSRDGGVTWSIENPAAAGALIPVGKALHGITPPGLKEKPWQDCPGGIDFTHPDFALTVRMTDVDAGPARFYYSTERGHTWEGPFRLPLFGQKGIAARTDYVVNGQRDCLLFLTAAKTNGREGRPLCVRTTDGGKTWQFVSWIGAEPRGYAIMPATVRLGVNELLTAIRCRNGEKTWIETYRSLDDGQSWQLDTTPAPELGEGNPPSLLRLKDGRLCLAYGYRAPPYGIRARLSGGDGRSWGREIILRRDGGGRDLGYPRTVQRPDGKIVTVYYFHDTPKGDRYIGATIWDPDKAQVE
jgi:predicted neuraminidase/polygalacturonase